MATSLSVAEMQGLYGPFTLTERVVQKIWLRGDFSRHRLTLTDGRRLEIRALGAWNLLGGPDFRSARIVIDGRERVGDIEVHFHAQDWISHGHARDRAYDNVVLHVVLFPLDMGQRPAKNFAAVELPTLVLLPHLHRDLEEYASDDALEGITERDEWERFAELASLPAPQLRQLLQNRADERWRQKVRYAKLRVDKLGFEDAAHHTALEILGYRVNRAAMLCAAEQFSLERWDHSLMPDLVFDELRLQGQWRLQGIRPANHPRLRLAQYQRWAQACPCWPKRLLQLAPTVGDSLLPSFSVTEPANLRRVLKLGEIREIFGQQLLGGEIRGTRLDNLMCDGFLPLLATQSPNVNFFPIWFYWFLGDVPARVRGALPKLGVTGSEGRTICHGWAQGLLGWLIEREARASG